MLGEALNAVQGIGHGGGQARVFAALAPYLTESLLEEAFYAVRTISNEEHLTEALIALMPYLTESLLREALNTVWGIENKHHRARVIAALTPKLPEPQRTVMLSEALKSVQICRDVDALDALAPYLSQTFLPKALYVAQSLPDASFPAAVRSLVDKMPAYLLSEALRTAAESITDERHRAASMAALAPYLTNDQLADALDAAQGLADESCQVKALAAIFPHMPQSQRHEAFTMVMRSAQSIVDPSSRADALAEFAMQLPETQRAATFTAALQAVQAIKNPQSQAKTLTKLGAYLTEPHLRKALDIADTIRNAESRSSALAALARYLPEAWRTDTFVAALRSVRTISEEKRRAIALEELVPSLPDDLIEDALCIAECINSRWDRPYAFKGLIPRISEAGRLDAIRRSIGRVDRDTALQMIALFAPVIAQGGHEMTDKIIASIQQIAAWWP